MKKVCVFFAEGTEECEALLPVDLLRRAGAEVTLAGIGDELFVTSSHGVQVKTDALAKDLDFSAFDCSAGRHAGHNAPWRKCACG